MTTNSIAPVASLGLTKDCQHNAQIIYGVCRTVTPQFYSKQTPAEMKLLCSTIALMTRNIRQDILEKMVELALDRYASARSGNSNLFFDVNYILSFYDEAWEKAKPEGFDWFVGVEGNAFLWARLEDADEQGNLPADAPIWRDERYRR